MLISALCCGRLSATPTCPIITQSFSGSANGSTVDTTVTGWYIDASSLVNPTYFAVKSNRFTAQNIGAEGVWYSRIFPVTGYSSFQVAVKITSESAQTADYVKIYYKIDGGAETLLDQRTGQFGTLDFTSGALTGSTVQLIVRLYNKNVSGTGSDPKLYIEQYRVFKEAGPCTPATIPVTAAISSSNKTITCTNSSVTLTAASTASGVTYKWTGPGGFTSTSASPTVFTGGTYEVIGTSSAGSGAAVVTVSANNTPPDLTATGGALGCSASVMLNAASSVSGVTYQWTGPNSFSSASASPSVGTLGTYTITITNPANGCTNTQTVQVVTGNATPTTFWNEDFTDQADGTTSDNGTTPWTIANSTTGTFAVASHEFKVNNIGSSAVGTWTSGSINISGRTNVSISVDVRSGISPGGGLEDNGASIDSISLYYILDGGTPVRYSSNLGKINNNRSTDSTISFGSFNGSTLQVMVRARTTSADEFYYFDNVKVSGILQTTVSAGAANSGPVTCKPDSVTLLGSSSTSGVSYAWTGPNSFSSTLQNPKVRTTGTYIVTVTNSGGCTATASTTVTENLVPPANVTASSGSGSTVITCTNATLTLTGSASGANLSFAWTGPNGFTASGASASAGTAGTYTVTATDTTNGCAASAAVLLQSNTTAPSAVTYTPVPASAQITCAVPGVSLTGSSATGTVRYGWTGPNNYSATGPTANAQTAGTYILTATDTVNGCTATANASVSQDILSPEGVTANGSNQITCNLPQVNLVGVSTTPGVTYSWTGPNGFTAIGAIVPTTVGGIYTLKVTNPANGCFKTLPTTVAQNTAPPANVTATSSGPLTCSVTEVTLTGSSSSPNVSYQWDGPDGYLSFSAQDVATEPGDYVLTVTNDDNGCILKDTTTVITQCGARKAVSEPAAAAGIAAAGFEWKVYPNPSAGKATVSFRLPMSESVTVQVYNSTGIAEKLLFNNRAAANQLYTLNLTENLPAGVHYFAIRVSNKVYTKKIVVIK